LLGELPLNIFKYVNKIFMGGIPDSRVVFQQGTNISSKYFANYVWPPRGKAMKEDANSLKSLTNNCTNVQHRDKLDSMLTLRSVV